MTRSEQELWRRASELFQEALDEPAGGRGAWLRARTEGDEALLEEVLGLLDAHEREGLLDRELDPPEPGELLQDRLDDALSDRYRLVRQLGQGGMSIVFLAWERKHGRRVVLKVLRPEVAAFYGEERFLEEVRLASVLSHPHILPFIDSGRADGLLYYVMPHVEGETLHARLARRGALPPGEAIPLLRDVAEALAYAHEQGVVHRDLKPANLLCAGVHAYLLDFGVAKTLWGRPDQEPLTRPGFSPGTPRYMAPEQMASRRPVDRTTDVFAWGQIAHEILAGEVVSPPWPTSAEVAAFLRGRRIAPGLADLVGACLSPDPDERPGASEIRDAVDALAAPPPPAEEGSRRRLAVGAAATVLLAVLGAAALSALRGPSELEADPRLPGPVAVAEFRNETGDPSLDVLGRLAGDWITQALQGAGLVEVVPWPMALEASTQADEGGTGDPVALLRSATGAGTVVTGAFYRVGDEIRFGAEVSDAVQGRVLAAPDPVAAPASAPQQALAELRERVLGSLAVITGGRLEAAPGLAYHMPTFEAYRVFDRGVEHYLAQEYGEATPAFLEAHRLDSTFLMPVLYAASTAWNSGDRARVDSLLRFVEPRRARLSRYDEYRWQYLRALLTSDGEGVLQAARRATALAPRSRAAYNLAMAAVRVNRPGEAVAALESLDPDAGAVRGWAQYWTQLTHARHLLGRHDEEAAAARAMAARHPERTVAPVLLARALAAGGRMAALDSALAAGASRSPRTYWSHGGALVVAGEELLAHGAPGAGRVRLEEALAWLDPAIEAEPGYAAHRYWRASALYDLERWSEAAEAFETLVAEVPGNTSYLGMAAVSAARTGDRDRAAARLAGDAWIGAEGERLAYEARVAAILGETGRAHGLLARAFTRGIDGYPWMHASGYREWELLEADPRTARLLEPAGD